MGGWAIATATIFAAAVAIIAYREFAAYLAWLEAVRLRAQAKPVIDRRLEALADRLEPFEIAPILAADLTNRDTTAIVVDRSGAVIGSAPPIEGPEPPRLPWERYQRALAEDPHVSSIARDPHRRRVLSVLIPPLPWRPDPPAVVQLATYLDSRERPLRFLRVLAAVILADSIVLVLLEAALVGPLTLLALAGVPLFWAIARRVRGGGPLTIEGEPRPSARSEGAVPLDSAVRRAEAAFLAQQASEDRLGTFVAEASHELRTPLTSVAGAADVLLEHAKGDPEQVERLARVISSEADRMRRLVEDLMTLARLDAAEPLRREPVRLDRLAVEHAEELEVSRGDRRVTVLAQPVTVRGDGDRLRQVLANLTSNALRHTAPGGLIEIGAALDDGAGVLTVRDDGDGIAEHDLPHVFTRFWRAQSARSGDGAGLGLAIVREIVEAHGGTVELTSRGEKGTCVIVRIPTTT
ncbi:MAG: sensor histidine kinase [Candidatus Limnocylindria bacterium]